MNKVIVVLFLSLTYVTHAQQGRPLKFLALGDSYTVGESVESTQNFPHQLIEQLGKKGIETSDPEIIAITGWRTDELLLNTKNHQPDIFYDWVSILIGVNNQYQDRPFKQFEKELPLIFEEALRLCDRDTQRIFFISIPDYYYTSFGQAHEKGEKISTELDKYNAHLEDFAAKLKIPFVNITSISRSLDSNLVASDGLHPSAYQYSLWVEKILNEVNFNP